ncbi:ABC transporter permease [Mycoplasmopsis primatum]|uniref:ABC transporter permease n=1 Tax=Mycoplasmopsis primatum TaxID=55604 RepID=UPI00068AC270|nr:ABC transporter permease [Mycoplasmopsis primatum]
MDIAQISYTYNLTIVLFCIFSLSAIGGMFSEKSGTVNIGINGMMVMGAITYVFFGHIIYNSLGNSSLDNTTPLWQLLLVPLSGIIGGLFACLHGYATIKLKSDQTISGFALNLLAQGLSLALLILLTKGSKLYESNNLKELAYYYENKSGQRFEIISLKLILTLVTIVVGYIILYKTPWGLRFRSIGENPQAADVAGVNVFAYKWQGIIISGVLSGIAGSFFVNGNTGFTFNGDVLGLGYLSLSIMIMGQWNILLIAGISLVFSFVYSLSYGLAQNQSLNSYINLLKGLPYVVCLIIVAATARNSKAPAASGVAYDKSKR